MAVTKEKIFLNSSLLDFNNEVLTNIILNKQIVQDQRIDELSKTVENLNFSVNTMGRNGYNDTDVFLPFELENYQMNHSDQIHLLNKIMSEVQELEGLNDIRDQITICVSICKDTLELIRKCKNTDKNNFYKDTLRLCYQGIKRNYSHAIFSQNQISIMLKMLKECKKNYIDEDQYWAFDEQLYHVGLNVFPEEA
ncbi:hypothetical protein IMSAGC012_00701 [Lachnospiraceae bacterium]|nr:hypothetical protein IMSAGC012_00701 [Lachnospiraceae bacterium]